MKPAKDSIIKRVRQICNDQGLHVDRETIEQVVESSGNDIR